MIPHIAASVTSCRSHNPTYSLPPQASPNRCHKKLHFAPVETANDDTYDRAYAVHQRYRLLKEVSIDDMRLNCDMFLGIK